MNNFADILFNFVDLSKWTFFLGLTFVGFPKIPNTNYIQITYIDESHKKVLTVSEFNEFEPRLKSAKKKGFN